MWQVQARSWRRSVALTGPAGMLAAAVAAALTRPSGEHETWRMHADTHLGGLPAVHQQAGKQAGRLNMHPIPAESCVASLHTSASRVSGALPSVAPDGSAAASLTLISTCAAAATSSAGALDVGDSGSASPPSLPASEPEASSWLHPHSRSCNNDGRSILRVQSY